MTGGSRLPSTRITAVRGSTLVPSRVTTSPSTSTSPSSISSSHLRREATPDWASSFCSRISPSSSARSGSDVGHVGSVPPSGSVLGPRSGVGRPARASVRRRPARPLGSSSSRSARSGRYGASSGSSSSDGDADPLEEVAGGAVEVRAGLVVLAGLLDQAAGEQGAHHAVDVDAADRRDPGPGDRLLVGDHGQGLQRRLGEPGLLALEHEALDDRGVLLARVVAPAAGRRCAARSRGPARRTPRPARAAPPTTSSTG